ncbi:MAG: phosphocholine cytidylyltransferase family protein [Proteobacteria bacterium]|nr:phosphocholine cytidylyltransferase family protein [Pseudomonadota bacterium]
MKAIILSAGQGKRLLPLTKKTPKAALRVGSTSVLEWQLQELAKCQIHEVVVITGFGADQIDHIIDNQKNMSARTLYNPFYSQSDNLGTCWIARHEMTAPFMIINGDTLFESAIVEKLLAANPENPINLVTDCKDLYDDDDMKVILETGIVKNVSKTLDRARVDGESIGMMSFNHEGASLFVSELNSMMRSGSGLSQLYLSAIDSIAQSLKVFACPIEGSEWCEIDSVGDLETAEKTVSRWL